ncbi:MAG: hypothetical protein A2W26_01200 [Acidobacteria bacterium RBG_16_64_8]|nr:MAG: hypothetical protein A2W26_01200 [Acidobacteria bacterium RBG_16_64_8]
MPIHGPAGGYQRRHSRIRGHPTILGCCFELQRKAEEAQGLDYLQVFADPKNPDRLLWFIEDGGAEPHVTALLPEDY